MKKWTRRLDPNGTLLLMDGSQLEQHRVLPVYVATGGDNSFYRGESTIVITIEYYYYYY